MRHRTERRRGTAALVVAVAVVIAISGCMPAISTVADVSRISLVSSHSVDGWRYDFYRNEAYPCAARGFQTFSIATKVGSSSSGTAPLWVYVHGGGTGYFTDDGIARPNEDRMDEEPAAELRSELRKGDLLARVRRSPTPIRMMAVSMCSHDLYGGVGAEDPGNPYLTPEGEPRTANGLFAAKAAVQFATSAYPTDDYLLHGTSAGASGVISVARGLAEQGLPADAIITDSGVANTAWTEERIQAGATCAGTLESVTRLKDRIHPEITMPAHSPEALFAEGVLGAPVLHIWSYGDPGQCGNQPMPCPMADGSTQVLGSVDCKHDPLRQAIDAGDGRSVNMRLCVDDPDRPGPCDQHVPTVTAGAVNTDPAWPSDFVTEVLAWAQARLADD